MNQEQPEQPNKKILTIEKVLGPNSDYNQIIVDIKALLGKHEGIVVSDYKETGISATNARFTREKIGRWIRENMTMSTMSGSRSKRRKISPSLPACWADFCIAEGKKN